MSAAEDVHWLQGRNVSPDPLLFGKKLGQGHIKQPRNEVFEKAYADCTVTPSEAPASADQVCPVHDRGHTAVCPLSLVDVEAHNKPKRKSGVPTLACLGSTLHRCAPLSLLPAATPVTTALRGVAIETIRAARASRIQAAKRDPPVDAPVPTALEHWMLRSYKLVGG